MSVNITSNSSTAGIFRFSMGFLCLLITMFSFTAVLAQERTITGEVTSRETGEALPGVNVIVQGTTQGTVTDISGNYRLNVPEDADVLTFSFIGLKEQNVQINGRSVIDVVMAEDAKQLSEIVVTAIGIEQSRRKLGYSVQEIESEEITRAPQTNLVNSMNGKLAGVNIVSSSGAPGASASIRIRGNTSIDGSNDPLFVVDGVPISNDAVGNGVGGVDQSNRAIDINPNDVESMTVLKGPSATALYGIRAANGAIIITTKKGKKGAAPTVNVNTTWEVSEVNRFMNLQQEYAQGRNGTYRGPEVAELWSWGPRIENLEYDGDESYRFSDKGRLVPVGEGNGQPAEAFDNPGNFFVPGLRSDNNVSVRGGTEKSNYYLSAGYLNDQGVIPNSNFERITLRTNVSTDITDKLTASLSANYVNSGGDRPERGSNLRGVMLGLIRNTPTFDLGAGKTGREAADDPSTYQFPDGTQRSYRYGVYDNTYWVVNKNYTTDDVNRIFGNASLNYEIIPGMNVSYKLGLDQYTDRRKARVGSVPNPFSPGAFFNPGEVDYDNIFSQNINSDLLLTYNKQLEEWSIDALVGHNYFSTNYRRVAFDGNGLSVPDFYHISNASPGNAQEVIERRKVNGAIAQANIGFRDMIYLNLTARNDWSSTLPDGENSFFYPAASLGLEFTEMLGISDNDILPYGKLRVSYGQVGNDAPFYATSNYFAQTEVTGDGFTDGLVFPILGQNAFEQDGDLGNNQLRPETTTTFEIGVDLRFFNNRLGLDVTYYNAETVDQILPVDISAASGYLSSVQNAGLVTNEGIEAVVNATLVESGSFRWDTRFNFTAYENIVEEVLPDLTNIFLAGFTSTSSRAIEGEPFGTLFGGGFQRVEDESSPYFNELIIGADGFPLTATESKILGDPNPDWILGVSNTFSYKGLSLSALVDIRQGGDVWNGTYGIGQYFGVTQHSADYRGELGDGVIYQGVQETESGEFVPNTQQVDMNNNDVGTGSNRWVRYGFGTLGEENVEDASWVRLREVRLAYTLPNALTDNLGVSAVDLALTGRNLLLFTGYRGIDPETNLTGTGNGFGLDYFNNPNTRGYGVSLNVTF